MTEQRFDPIHYYDRDGNACGKMKECDDGDYVRFNKYLDEKPTKEWLEEQGFWETNATNVFNLNIVSGQTIFVSIANERVLCEISMSFRAGFPVGVQAKRDVLRVIEVFSKEIPSD